MVNQFPNTILFTRVCPSQQITKINSLLSHLQVCNDSKKRLNQISLSSCQYKHKPPDLPVLATYVIRVDNTIFHLLSISFIDHSLSETKTRSRAWIVLQLWSLQTEKGLAIRLQFQHIRFIMSGEVGFHQPPPQQISQHYHHITYIAHLMDLINWV